MQEHQRAFVDFMLEVGVLTFGDFTTKSGRKTPFFVNTGRYRTGSHLDRLGRFYAETIVARFGDSFDVLFGPAYKGIPLVVATASALAREFGRDVAFCFDRKEAKDHGEGGVIVGHKLQDGDRVLIVEDVTTAGTSVRETVPKLRAAADVALAGLVVSVDRQERGQGPRTALAELQDEFAMPTCAIVTIDEVVGSLRGREVNGVPLLDADLLARIAAYRAAYGAER
ncbi:MAG: orotate phosphoribosyltransferase [Planctomycetota bacterium]